jgi:hypothetical protein
MENASAAILDTLSLSAETALDHQSLLLLMLDAPSGVQTAKSASSAQTDSSLTAMVAVQLFLIYALLGIKSVEIALAAITDMILAMESAAYHSHTLIQLMLDAPPGTGISNSASSALTTGSSTATKSASKFQTNATPSTALVPASVATKDTT